MMHQKWTLVDALVTVTLCLILAVNSVTCVRCYTCATEFGGDQTCRESPELTAEKECDACYTLVWAKPVRAQGLGMVEAKINMVIRGCTHRTQVSDGHLKCQVQLGYRGHVRTHSYRCVRTCADDLCNDGYRRVTITDMRRRRRVGYTYR